MQLKLPIITVHAVERLQDAMAIIHTVSSTSTAFCTCPIPWVLMTDSPLSSCLNYSSR
jgi:hypothetical protein